MNPTRLRSWMSKYKISGVLFVGCLLGLHHLGTKRRPTMMASVLLMCAMGAFCWHHRFQINAATNTPSQQELSRNFMAAQPSSPGVGLTQPSSPYSIIERVYDNVYANKWVTRAEVRVDPSGRYSWSVFTIGSSPRQTQTFAGVVPTAISEQLFTSSFSFPIRNGLRVYEVGIDDCWTSHPAGVDALLTYLQQTHFSQLTTKCREVFGPDAVSAIVAKAVYDRIQSRVAHTAAGLVPQKPNVLRELASRALDLAIAQSRSDWLLNLNTLRCCDPASLACWGGICAGKCACRVCEEDAVHSKSGCGSCCDENC